MSLEKMGLGGVLVMDVNQAVTAMGSAGQASQTLAQAAGQLPPAASQAGQALDALGKKAQDAGGKTETGAQSIAGAVSKVGGIAGTLGMALAPLAAGFGLGIKDAADFEKQMSNVGAVSLGSAADMSTMTAKAKELGVVTAFSATAAGQAMENMARAGATVPEIMSGIKGVLDAAAAGGLDLATSSDLVSKTVRGMGIEFSNAGKVADIYAMVSSKTNTDMTSLGEAFKYAAAESRVLGIDVEHTAIMLGLAADAGNRGSVGGTSFAAMLKKLAKPSQEANKWLKANRIEFTKTAEGGLDIIDVTKQLVTAMDKETDVMVKARLQAELFGDRGAKAFSAFDASIKSGKMDKFADQVMHAAGTADQMAKRRLDNFSGRMTLLASSIQVFFIETFGGFLKPMSATLDMVTDGINNVILVMQALNGHTETDEALIKKYGANTVAVAVGISDGFKWVIATIGEVKATFLDMFKSIAGDASPEIIKSIAKIVTILVLVGGLAAPVLLAFAGVAAFVSSVVIPAISAIAAVIEFVAGAVSGWGLIAIAVFAIFRNQGESVWGTFQRMFNAIGDLINWVVDNAIMPFAKTFLDTVVPYAMYAWEKLKTFGYSVREMIAQLIGSVVESFRYLGPFFRGLFSVLGSIIGWFVSKAIVAFGILLDVLTPVFRLIKDIAMWIIDKVVNHIHTLVKTMVTLADAVGKSDWVPKGFRDFAAQPSFNIGDSEASTKFNELGSRPKVAKDGKKGFMDQLADAFTQKEGEKGKPGGTTIDLKLEDKRKIDVNACTKIDGREVAMANAKHTQEVNDRNGFKATPWQRRVIAESGAKPVGGLGN